MCFPVIQTKRSSLYIFICCYDQNTKYLESDWVKQRAYLIVLNLYSISISKIVVAEFTTGCNRMLNTKFKVLKLKYGNTRLSNVSNMNRYR